MFANIGTYGVKVLVNILIAISQYADTQLPKLGISLQIFLSMFGLAVLHAVNFNCDSFFGDEKIKDKIADAFLTIDGKGEVL